MDVMMMMMGKQSKNETTADLDLFRSKHYFYASLATEAGGLTVGGCKQLVQGLGQHIHYERM